MKSLDAWIATMRASGHWISSCPSCGYLFAQRRKGARAQICDWHRCVLWGRWRRRYGRAPPDWLRLRWKAIYGDSPARPQDKRYAYARRAAAQGAAA